MRRGEVERCYVCHGDREVTIDTTGTYAPCTCPRCRGRGYITSGPFLEDVTTGLWRTGQWRIQQRGTSLP